LDARFAVSAETMEIACISVQDGAL
jgi:hypothetical protein